MGRPRIEVNLEELDQVLEEARQAPLSEDDYQKLKTALHALAEWARSQSTEKTKTVLGEVQERSPMDAVMPQVPVKPREVSLPASARDTDATEPRLFEERRRSRLRIRS